ncbi:Anti-sigma-K factor rskA [Rubripirellula obstinata]|uniref:Anti-sigma-K factor rskA n=1 Tax=Rubripirellula obstinata TaxID=406547 RepID=A0A5B1CMM6_9BACT|nr:anti-sigma factor [Rubripirellula obstinata]KAA1261806.1 Anti-sigma-K factor rskA [Rubripirellula obstinata]
MSNAKDNLSQWKESQWQELLAGHVLDDLSEEEQIAFQAAFSNQEDQQSLFELENTMARVQLAFQHPNEPMPDSLRVRIANDAGKHLSADTANIVTSTNVSDANLVTTADVQSSPSLLRTREVFAWLAFAAAALLAFGFWSVNTDPPAVMSVAQLRSNLISQADDVIKVDWTAGKHPFPQEVQGDVVWSNDRQAGYMRFKQMPVNDPTLQQYQLWIIDPLRDDEPIDGGVFNVSADGEVIVPIDAKLQVLKPAAFAITIEKPGGVVVSTQERLPLLASVVSSE